MLTRYFAITSMFLSVITFANTVELFVGEQRTLQVPGASQITIAGQGKIARGILTSDNSQIVVSGVAVGEVSLTISFKDGRRELWTIKVSGRESEMLHLEASALVAGFPSLSIRKSGTQVALAGTFSSEEEERRVKMISDRYPEILNLTNDSRIDSIIQIDVEIIEINVTNGRETGIDWVSGTETDASVKDGISYGRLKTSGNEIVIGEKTIPENLVPGPAYALGPIARLSPVMARIKLLVENGKGSILARPRLVCRSGDTARFLAGGQMPIVYATTEQAGVEWKPYGIKLKVQPVLIGIGGKMRLSVDCEVSEIDWTNRVGNYPALSEKSISTHVSLKANEALALAGLITKRNVRNIRKIPVLGSIPFIGKLFSVERASNDNLETVILLTPRVIRNGAVGIEIPQSQHN